MDIEIHTHDTNLIFDMLGKTSVSVDDEIQVSDDVRLTFKGSLIRKALDFPEIVYFAITFGSGVAAGMAANWLYDRLKGKKIAKLVIERTEVELDRGEIKKVIDEKLRVE